MSAAQMSVTDMDVVAGLPVYTVWGSDNVAGGNVLASPAAPV